ncbi:ABC transporter substrate-binding protein [Fodinisporobacter ferrooxydans]|uniref:ABC transporter substrate-binding protein n=1 Tax=Fodinisporobacter ferrooxydans TaxID=2901836 RepID=A0ABY4CDS8_9BACL|nr:ABC transporter substrate-binding protein [Alicyclobacillaceae bacterium MYW30-H2]
MVRLNAQSKVWKHRGIQTAAVFMMSTALLAGCGSSSTSTNATGSSGAGSSGTSSTKPVTITFASGKDATGTVQLEIKKFEEENPNIKVNYIEEPQSSDEYHNQLVTKLSAGDNSIDVYAMDIIWPPEFGAAKWNLPLNQYFSKADLSAMLPGPVQGDTYKGTLYAVPWFTDAGVLYYRKDILDKAGIQPPKTFDELMKDAEKLKGQGGTQYGFVFQAKQYEGLVCDYLEYLWGNGGDVLNKDGKVVIDSPNNLEATKFFVNLVKSDVVPKGIDTFMEEDARRLFTEGKAVFMRNWPYAWSISQGPESKVKGEVGMAPMPVGPHGTEPAATLGGWNLGVNANIKKDHVAAAIKFLKFMTSPEAQKLSAIKGSRLPILKETYKDADVLKVDPQFAQLYPVFIHAKPRPVSPVYPQISDSIQINVHKAMLGEETPEQALKTMQDQISKLVK